MIDQELGAAKKLAQEAMAENRRSAPASPAFVLRLIELLEAADRVMIECGFAEGEAWAQPSWGGHPQDGINIASGAYLDLRKKPLHDHQPRGDDNG